MPPNLSLTLPLLYTKIKVNVTRIGVCIIKIKFLIIIKNKRICGNITDNLIMFINKLFKLI